MLLLHAARRTLLQQVVQARRRRRGILVLLRVHGQVGFGAAVCPMQTHVFIDALFGKDVLGLSAAAQQQQQQQQKAEKGSRVSEQGKCAA